MSYTFLDDNHDATRDGGGAAIDKDVDTRMNGGGSYDDMEVDETLSGAMWFLPKVLLRHTFLTYIRKELMEPIQRGRKMVEERVSRL